MLSWACRRFRARFAPGSAHPHRRTCRECDAYAAALETAAGVRLPVPARLRRSLSEIAAPAPPSASVLPFPVPRLAMPGDLSARLRGIAPPRCPPQCSPRAALPEWARSPRYAVAASALLALLLGPFLAGAAERGREALGQVREEVSPIVQRTEETGREKIEKLGLTAGAACGAARRTVQGSLQRLDEGISGLAEKLSIVSTEDIINLGSGDDPPSP